MRILLVTVHTVKRKTSHDARLVAAMQRHDVTHLLTFNRQDFLRFTEITTVTPPEVLSGVVPALTIESGESLMNIICRQFRQEEFPYVQSPSNQWYKQIPRSRLHQRCLTPDASRIQTKLTCVEATLPSFLNTLHIVL